jgi:transcriptional regulator with XRE-family HTH domain
MDKATPAPRRVTRVQLGILLREWRDRAGLSSKDAADLLEWHPSKLSKVEKGAARISAAELDRLLDKYGVPPEEAERMRALGKEARKRGVAGRVPDWGQTYVELEQGADEIRMYSDELIPGVLQTDDYARALISTWPNPSSEDIDERLAYRVQRRRRLLAEPAPDLWVVLGEAALYRLVAGREGLWNQLRWLRELADHRSVSLQILPFSVGEHIALGAGFSILSFREPRTTFVYYEGLTGATYLDRPPHTEVYSAVFQRLLVAAANERESKRMLDERIKELS